MIFTKKLTADTKIRNPFLELSYGTCSWHIRSKEVEKGYGGGGEGVGDGVNR